MAVLINQEYYTIVLNAKSIKRIMGEDGIKTFLKNEFPNEDKERSKVQEYYSKPHPIWNRITTLLKNNSSNKPQETQEVKHETIDSFCHDDYEYRTITKRISWYDEINDAWCYGPDISARFGFDGNIVFISYKDKTEFWNKQELLLNQGFFTLSDMTNEKDVDFYTIHKNELPIHISKCTWLSFKRTREGIYIFHPSIPAIKPQRFPSGQGGIQYSTELFWELSQKYTLEGNFKAYMNLDDIDLIYEKVYSIEDRDEWLRQFDEWHDKKLCSEFEALNMIKTCVDEKRSITSIYGLFDESVIARLSNDVVEAPMPKYDVMKWLAARFDEFNIQNIIVGFAIKYLPSDQKNIGILALDTGNIRISVDVVQNRIKELWFVNEEFYLSPTNSDMIISNITNAWCEKDALYIERFLHPSFTYTMYGDETIFGNSKLSKRQYIIWLDTRFESIVKHDLQFHAEPKSDGILIQIGETLWDADQRFIKMDIVDGLILNAQELQVSQSHSPNNEEDIPF